MVKRAVLPKRYDNRIIKSLYIVPEALSCRYLLLGPNKLSTSVKHIGFIYWRLRNILNYIVYNVINIPPIKIQRHGISSRMHHLDKFRRYTRTFYSSMQIHANIHRELSSAQNSSRQNLSACRFNATPSSTYAFSCLFLLPSLLLFTRAHASPTLCLCFALSLSSRVRVKSACVVALARKVPKPVPPTGPRFMTSVAVLAVTRIIYRY
jgi:hypothetical protein